MVHTRNIFWKTLNFGITKVGDEEGGKIFNTCCQTLMTRLLLCLDTAIGLNKCDPRSCFLLNFHEFLASATLYLILQTLNPRMQSRIFLEEVLFCLVIYFKDIMMQCVTKQNNNDTPYNPFTFESYAKIQRFVGWDIYSREKNVQKKLRELKDKRDNKSGGNKKLTETIVSLEMENEILISMTTYKKDIEEDKEYMTAYYPTAFRLYNNGGLTLVSKKYIKWAKALVVEVNQHVNIEKIWKKNNMIMK